MLFLGWGVLQVIQPLVQQPSLPVVKQSVKERLGPVPASNIEPTEAQSANTEVTQVCMICQKKKKNFLSVLGSIVYKYMPRNVSIIVLIIQCK